MREARLEFEAAVAESGSIGHESLRGHALRRLGIVLSDTGKRSEALACLSEALSIHRREGNLREEASTLVNIANLRRAEGSLDEADRLFTKAISAAQRAGDARLEALALVNLSNLLAQGSGAGKAKPALTRALKLAKRGGDRTLHGAILGNLAEVQVTVDSPKLAVATYEKALKINREVGNRISECAALRGLASLRLLLGHYEPAQEAFLGAIDIAKEIGNRRLEATHLANLGLLDYQVGRLSQGRERVDRARDIAREIGNPWMEGLALDLMALLLSAEGDLDEACLACKKSIDTLCNSSDRRGLGGAMHHETVLNLLTHRSVAETRAIAGRAEEALREVGDRMELAKLGCTRGHIALALGKSGQAFLSDTEELLRDSKRGTDAEFRIYAGKLSRAQVAFDAGEPLVCGYAPPDITEGQRRWLMERRRDAIPTDVCAEWSTGTKT